MSNIHVLSSDRIFELQHPKEAITGKNLPEEDLLTHDTDTQ